MGGLRGVAFIPKATNEVYIEVDSKSTLKKLKDISEENENLRNELEKAAPLHLKEQLDQAKIEIQSLKSNLFSLKTTDKESELQKSFLELQKENQILKDKVSRITANVEANKIVYIEKPVVKEIRSEPKVITKIEEKTNMKHILIAVLISFACSTTITYELINYFKKDKKVETVTKKVR